MTDCTVCLFVDDGGPQPAFYTSRRVMARRPHRCCECGDAIAVGDRYERVTGKWDGRISTFTTCLNCVDIAEQLSCNGFRLHERLWEDLDEIRTEMGLGCLNRLTRPSAKAKLQAYLNEAAQR
jgi:hypothetical protein